MNLFLSTRRLTSAKEDHLTEFLAAALKVDRVFRDAYASLILSDYAAQKAWVVPEIAEVTAQRYYKEDGCCPDLELTLRDGHVIACEHKIEAPETLGEEAGDGGELLQLERYLKLPIDGLAYFRSSWAPPAANVLENQKYVKPPAREHFLWSDIHSALREGTTDVARWLYEGFKDLGYTPPYPAVGDLEDPDPDTRKRNRQNFAKLWQSTRSGLREMGWKVSAGSICELYLQSNSASTAELIYVSPKNGGRVLLIRVTPRDHDVGLVLETEQRLGQAAETLHLPVELTSTSVRRAGGHRAVVDIAVSLANLLQGASTVPEMESKLRSYVVPLISAIPIETESSALIGSLADQIQVHGDLLSTGSHVTENKRTVERYMDGFRKSDHEQILSCLTEDVVWDMPGAFHLVGKEAFDGEIENPAFVGRPTITITRMVEEDDVVVAEGAVRAERKDGGLLNAVFCDAFIMKEGKIQQLTSYLMEVK